jgi:hypothetical protein
MSAQIQRLTFERVAPPENAAPSADVVERSIDLAFELATAVLDNPELLDRVPDGMALALLPPEDPEVAQANTELGNLFAHRGFPVAWWPLGERGKGTVYHFTIDLRDEVWGTAPRPEFEGRTAAELRDVLANVHQESRDGKSFKLRYENIAVLNGVRIYIEEEVAPGLYRCVAIDQVPLR